MTIMKPSAVSSISAAFAALSDPTRRAILARLARGEAAAGELAQPFRMTAPAISRHLRVLSEAGLVERRIDARWRIYRLNGTGLKAAHDWLRQYRDFWESSLDRLVEYVERAGAAAGSAAGPPDRTRRAGSRQIRPHLPKRKA